MKAMNPYGSIEIQLHVFLHGAVWSPSRPGRLNLHRERLLNMRPCVRHKLYGCFGEEYNILFFPGRKQRLHVF